MAPESGHRIFDREQGRLGDGRLTQPLRRFFLVNTRFGIEQAAQVQSEMGLQAVCTLIQGGTENRLVPVKCPGHARILASLSAAEEHDGRCIFRRGRVCAGIDPEQRFARFRAVSGNNGGAMAERPASALQRGGGVAKGLFRMRFDPGR